MSYSKTINFLFLPPCDSADRSYSFGYLAYWRAIVGREFQAEAGGAFYYKRVGETHIVVIKHPAATEVTSAYFEEVGRFICERHVQLSVTML